MVPAELVIQAETQLKIAAIAYSEAIKADVWDDRTVRARNNLVDKALIYAHCVRQSDNNEAVS